MSLPRNCLILAALLTAGCASAPDRTSPALGAIDTSSGTVAAVTAEPASIETLTADEQRDPGSVIVCRQMLKEGSNVIVRYCLSRDDWKRYERRQARDAAAIVRTLQGGAYR